jgi:hypothetical protein
MLINYSKLVLWNDGLQRRNTLVPETSIRCLSTTASWFSGTTDSRGGILLSLKHQSDAYQLRQVGSLERQTPEEEYSCPWNINQMVINDGKMVLWNDRLQRRNTLVPETSIRWLSTTASQMTREAYLQ